MSRLVHLYRSQVGKKVLVAVTGVLMLAFLVVHLIGNLKVFLPNPEPGVADIDVYAEALRTLGEPFVPRSTVVWLNRIGLLAVALLHVVLVIQLSLAGRAARQTRYAGRRYTRATWAARLMMLSGLTLLGYIVFHLLHLTAGVIEPERFVHGALYFNMYEAFTRWPFVAIYVLGMTAVAFHLYHGAWSAFQTLGLDSPERNRLLRSLAITISVVFWIGFTSIPLSFLTGVLGPPPSQPEAHAAAPTQQQGTSLENGR